jgi:hypothetical protein
LFKIKTLSLPKKSNIATYQLIANILNFDNEDTILKTQLETSNIDWENLVKLASTHLVLTTVYCRLGQRKLLNNLPKDLLNYLEELTSINRNRNIKLIEEARILVNILEQHNIQYVFIKGMALLLGGYYKDLGERMIGDFDILVNEKDLEKTFDIFKKEGYDKLVKFNYKRPNFRHLPRQINKHKLAAIELHRHILNPSYRNLISLNDVFKNKRVIENNSIPSQQHLSLINILTTQLNDKSYYYNTLNFKNVYDNLVLNKHLENPIESQNSKFRSHFLDLNSVWFSQYKPMHASIINQIKKKNYTQKIRHETFERLINVLKLTSLSIADRLNLVLKNKSYRLYLIKSLISPKS